MRGEGCGWHSNRSCASECERLFKADSCLYQLYSYLRTQEAQTLGQGWLSEGILLHPQCDSAMDAYVDMQGHRLRVKTIDLMGSATEVEAQLLGLAEGFA